jgi:GTP diphosphokinase / guanosine-3',5'-bis(diphosphate) 3'-diphosphatase
MDRQKILRVLKSYDPNFDEARINKAIDFAIHYHKDQTRASGEPYYHHPLQVAEIILEMKLDSDSVITALLHDAIEDTALTLEDIKEHFGDEVAKLVDGVTKLSKIEFVSSHKRQAENFRKLFLAMSEDIRVLLVKLADRLHNMRTIQFIKSPEKRYRIAMETMDIYAPLAERIGIQKIKVELQDIGFSVLQPEIRNSIIEKLDSLAINEEKFINKVVQEIADTIKAEGIDGEVYGRHKTPYSIWLKMRQKNLNLDQLSDIIAFRVIVNTLGECYQVLGTIHMKYQMVPESFQDFISTPKSNSYMSLHTVVIGPMQQKIEIQIRTHDMHEVAELGVAAHWKYKQGYGAKEDGKQYKWIRELLTILDQNSDPEEFLQNTKLAMYYNQVFCFTPGGKLIALPKRATVIDFAYAVHSNIGRTCIGAKINGRMHSLKTVLKNGDQVEILTSKTQTPAQYWEKHVITGKARSEIRRYTRSQRKSEYIRIGKLVLEKTIKAAKIPNIAKAINDACKIFKRSKIEDVYRDIAKGVLSGEDIVAKLLPNKQSIKSTFSLLKFKKPIKTDHRKTIPISGLISGVAVHFAGCCNPLPEDKIVGVIHTGKGITVHAQDCNMLSKPMQVPGSVISLTWSDPKISRQVLVVRLKVEVVNEPGALAAFTAILAKENINITDFKLTRRTADFVEFDVDIDVKSLEDSDNVIKNIQGAKFINSVQRVKI